MIVVFFFGSRSNFSSSGVKSPLAEETEEIFSSALPGFVIVISTVFELPIMTFPKSTSVSDSAISGIPVTESVTGISTVSFRGSLVASVITPS